MRLKYKIFYIVVTLPLYVLLCKSYYPNSSKLKLIIEMWRCKKEFTKMVNRAMLLRTRLNASKKTHKD